MYPPVRDYPELRDVSRLTLLHSLCCVRLVLWDESRQRLISFREMSSRGGNNQDLVNRSRTSNS
jgi:hypothetical protein